MSSYPPPAQQGMTANSLFSGLFDIKFTRFVTVKIISIIYTLALVLISLGVLGMVLYGFSQGAGMGLAFLIGGSLYWFFLVMFLRIGLELYAVIFRIGDNTSYLVKAAGGPAGGAPGAVGGYGGQQQPPAYGGQQQPPAYGGQQQPPPPGYGGYYPPSS